MDHIAIMNKSWKLIPKILSGEKTIESRWYKTRRAPWNKITTSDIIFFKNSGEKVTAKTEVSSVSQFTLKNISDVKKVIKKYGKEICLVNSKPKTWGKILNYCILIGLKNPEPIKKPFQINKKGFGGPVAWITCPDIRKIIQKSI
ncbi:MAG: ASCH domain-containing protein [Patescibacteria group bacterium]